MAAGNVCDVLTVTAPTDDADVLAARRGVWISARVHPGETNASWMMKGVIDFVTGPSAVAKELREGFVFKVRAALAHCSGTRCSGMLCGTLAW